MNARSAFIHFVVDPVARCGARPGTSFLVRRKTHGGLTGFRPRIVSVAGPMKVEDTREFKTIEVVAPDTEYVTAMFELTTHDFKFLSRSSV
jgi:hypothetical protein